jgi:hypothetical protein
MDMNEPVAGRGRTLGPGWYWHGWTGTGPLWVNLALLLLLPLLQVPLVSQLAVVTTLAALGGLVRQLVFGDYGHPGMHSAAVLAGGAAVAAGLTAFPSPF